MKKFNFIFLGVFFFIFSFNLTVYAFDLDDLKKQYPKNKYLITVAEGDTLSEAKYNAKAELSSIFNSQIQSDTEIKVQSAFKDDKESFTKNIKNKIKVISTLEIKGLEISKTWFNEKEKKHYALCTLDKIKAKDIWDSEIEKIDDKIDAENKILSNLKNDNIALKHLKNVVNLWLDKEVIVTKLKIIGFSSSSFLDFEIKDVYNKISKIKATRRIYIEISSQDSNSYIEEAGQIFTKEGFIVVKERDAANLFIEGNIKTESLKLQRKDNVKVFKAYVNLSLLDTDQKTKLVEAVSSQRSMHINGKEAKKRAEVRSIQDACRKILDFF